MYSKAHKFRFVNNIFCTRTDWERVGGIPSLARAVSDRNTLFPTFHGPAALDSCLERFAILTDLEPDQVLTDRCFNPEPYYDDSHLQIDFVNLYPTEEVSKQCDVMAFVCRIKPKLGKFNVDKFSTLNIPIQYMKQLSHGTDVTLEDGTVINADDLRFPEFQGGNFLGK